MKASRHMERIWHVRVPADLDEETREEIRRLLLDRERDLSRYVRTAVIERNLRFQMARRRRNRELAERRRARTRGSPTTLRRAGRKPAV